MARRLSARPSVDRLAFELRAQLRSIRARPVRTPAPAICERFPPSQVLGPPCPSAPGGQHTTPPGRLARSAHRVRIAPMDLHGIHFDEQAFAAFCRRRGICKAALFGSILREDFRPDSDVDVLVEFHAASLPTLLDLVDMEIELSALLGRKVDLRTPEDLSEYFRDAVIRTARVQYAA